VRTNSELIFGIHLNTYRPQPVNAHGGETSAQNCVAGPGIVARFGRIDRRNFRRIRVGGLTEARATW
jgi:hypothetical protein